MSSPLDLTPDEFRHVANTLAEAMARYLGDLPARRVAGATNPQELIAAFDEPMPREGKGLAHLLTQLRERILPESMGIGSPRYFGQFNPSPIPLASLCDVVVSVLNQNAGSFLQSPVMTAIESRVIHWLIERAGLPSSAYGTFTNGGTAANLTALKIARDRAFPAVREQGARAMPRCRVYASDQVHFSIARSLDILGLGREVLCRVDSDANFRLDPGSLERAIAADRLHGIIPLAIVATAGTTPTGSLDPLLTLSAIARRERAHFHVDAAYGGAALLSDRLRPRLAGIEHADSITIDPHKWMMMPNEAGCILVRDKSLLIDSFNEQPHYLADSADRHSILPDYYRHGMQGSRHPRSFKLWAVLQVLGRDAIASARERHVELAQYLREAIAKLPGFEICHSTDFAVTCFRFAPQSCSHEQQDEANRRIQRAVESSGEAWFATTMLRGRKVLRVNIESFRTTEADIDRLIAAVVAASQAL
jgi:glutamate/tyrosine decarboxylase-like PLP-dependent enzyme